MPRRRAACALVAVCLVAVWVSAQTGGRTTIHRNGFSAKGVFFQKGDSNVAFVEKDHKITAEHHKSATTSESIKIEANPPPGATEPEYVNYYYACPPALLAERMTARVQVKAYRAGVQVKARVVLPQERDPKNPDAPLTVTITGERYDKVRQWQPLGFDEDALGVFKRQLPVLRAKLGREVNAAGAYLDRIIVNVYAGPGITEVWLDDLEVGPVRDEDDASAAAPDQPAAKLRGDAATRPKPKAVEFAEGQILVDGDPFFFLGIRHTDTPLKTLRDAGFNTVFFPNDATPATIEEAIRHGFWTVPTLPLPKGEWAGSLPKKPDAKQVEDDADMVARFVRKFKSGDAVLMWDFGGGRTAEDLPRVARAADAVRAADPRRPRSVDLWDGFAAYSNYVDAIGAHRWPLFSSLELSAYRDWLLQRKALLPPGKLMWTWVQTHMPEWLITQLYGRPDVASFADPVGPQPEQIRILTYLSLAAGCRGLGFWSDQFLAKDTHSGKDRLLELALLNAEIDMLRPVLNAANDPAVYVGTSDPNVTAAIVRGPSEILVLPVWTGSGTQHVPPQGALANLNVTVPLVPDGSIPWRVTPAGIEEMKGFVRGPQGAVLTIPDFDLAAAIVITTDLGPTGKVVRWQDHVQFRMGKTAAEWAHLEAVEVYEKVTCTHQKIVAAGGPELEDAGKLFEQARELINCAKVGYENKQWDLSYRESRRALRPLRVLMRADWQKAVGSLDTPTATPFATGFYTLPQHWQFAQEVKPTRPGGNALPHGGFELVRKAPDTGAAVDSLPGYKVRQTILDAGVTGLAAIVNADTLGIPDAPPKAPVFKLDRAAPARVGPQPLTFRQPDCGRHCLKLSLAQDFTPGKDGKAPLPLAALERAIVAVDTPPAELPPGSVARVSFWAKVPQFLAASADGLIVFDSAGGEPLGYRTLFQPTWRQVHLYRRVPPSGKISLTFALTGLGQAFIDEVKVEPMVPGDAPVVAGAAVLAPTPDALPPSAPLPPPKKELPAPPSVPSQALPAPRGRQ